MPSQGGAVGESCAVIRHVALMPPGLSPMYHMKISV